MNIRVRRVELKGWFAYNDELEWWAKLQYQVKQILRITHFQAQKAVHRMLIIAISPPSLFVVQCPQVSRTKREPMILFHYFSTPRALLPILKTGSVHTLNACWFTKLLFSLVCCEQDSLSTVRLQYHISDVCHDSSKRTLWNPRNAFIFYLFDFCFQVFLRWTSP